jgi:hypothetical protein
MKEMQYLAMQLPDRVLKLQKMHPDDLFPVIGKKLKLNKNSDMIHLKITGRERLKAVLNKQPTDRLPWTTLVDDVCLNGFPGILRGNYGVDFYRHLGCDIFMLNGWNTPHQFENPVLHWPDSVVVKSFNEDGKTIQQWQTPRKPVWFAKWVIKGILAMELNS